MLYCFIKNKFLESLLPQNGIIIAVKTILNNHFYTKTELSAYHNSIISRFPILKFELPFLCYTYMMFFFVNWGPVGSMSQVVGLFNNSYKHITNTAWFRTRICKLQKRCTQLAAASDKIYKLLAHGRWLSSGTPASSTTETGRHDIAMIQPKYC